MKRSMLLLGVILVATVVVYAANPVKYELTPAPDSTSEATGFAIVNWSPDGATDIVIQVSVKGAAPDAAHEIRSSQAVLAEFMTNGVGNGNVHINLSPDDVLGNRINVWDVSDGDVRILWTGEDFLTPPAP